MDSDVRADVQRLRRERGIGASEAVNEMVRRGLAAADVDRPRFAQTTSDLGAARLPLDDISELLGAVEGPGSPVIVDANVLVYTHRGSDHHEAAPSGYPPAD